MKVDSKDKFIPYRYEGIAGVARRLCDYFDRHPQGRR